MRDWRCVSIGRIARGAEHRRSRARGPAPTLAPSGARDAKPSTPAGSSIDGSMLEPIRMHGQLTDSAVQAAIKPQHFPNQLERSAADGDTVTVGAAKLVWHALDTIALQRQSLSLRLCTLKPTSNVLFWAVTVVDSPREMQDVRLAIGSNAASRLVAQRRGGHRPLQRPAER